MVRDADRRRRALGVCTLRHITGPTSFSSLVPALEDLELEVRSLAPAALMRVGARDAAVSQVSRAVRNGFPSIEAIAMLNEAGPPDLCETLIEMLERWSPEPADRSGSAIILAALPSLLARLPDPSRLLRALCRVLSQPLESGVAVAVLHAIETVGFVAPAEVSGVMECLFEQAAAPNPAVRRQAARALAKYGDVFTGQVIDFLDECKPQDSFFSQLQVILRGGRDAGQAASQAVQQVSKWWARLTSDAAEGSRPVVATGAAGPAPVLSDPRLPDTLRRMLAAVLRRRHSSDGGADADETAAFIVLLLRALSRLGLPAARGAWQEIVTVLHLPADALSPGGQATDPKWRDATAAAAAEALMALYGSDSFGLFLETLYSPRVEVARTGITALGLLGDSRGLTHLRAIAADTAHPCAAMATHAVAQIRRTNPEMMSLLRGSSGAGSDPATLLRAARSDTGATPADLLLRPTAEQPDR
jgi:HEAT repeat protein